MELVICKNSFKNAPPSTGTFCLTALAVQIVASRAKMASREKKVVRTTVATCSESTVSENRTHFLQSSQCLSDMAHAQSGHYFLNRQKSFIHVPEGETDKGCQFAHSVFWLVLEPTCTKKKLGNIVLKMLRIRRMRTINQWHQK